MVEVFHRVIIVGGFGYGARMFSPFYILRPKIIAIGGNHPSSKIGILSRFIAENEDGGQEEYSSGAVCRTLYRCSDTWCLLLANHCMSDSVI